MLAGGTDPGVLIRWIRTVRLQLRERFRQDLPILHLHSDRGAPHWLSHGGRSYLHDPCGCSPFSVAVCGPVRCASAQPLAPCLLAGDLANTALVFQVWGSRAFVCDTSADKLSARAIPCVFLGFPLDAPGWQFYHPTSRCVLPSQDVTFDKSVPFYHPLPGTVPVEVVVDSGAARGLVSGGEEPGGTEPVGAELEGAEPRGAEREGAELGGAESEGAESGGAGPRAARVVCLVHTP
ncbi:unnamed protein product [Closterium sp. NIES-53]